MSESRETPKDIGIPVEPSRQPDEVPGGKPNEIKSGMKATYKSDILSKYRGHGS